MKIDELKILDALFQEPNLTRIADRFHLSQGNVSKILKRLEQELGFALFERKGFQGLKPTAQGTLFAERVGRFTRSWDDTLALVKSHDRRKVDLKVTGPKLYMRNVFLRRWFAVVPQPGPYARHWGFLHRGAIMLRDDSGINFSPEMYDTFFRPYDQRLLREFGGGAVHFCGRGSHYIASLSTCEGLTAVQLSQPNYNDMETIYRHTVDKGIALLGLQREAAETALRAGRPLHGRVHCW